MTCSHSLFDVSLHRMNPRMLQGNKTAIVNHTATWVWNVAIGSICLLLVTVFLGNLLWRVLDAVRLHKHW